MLEDESARKRRVAVQVGIDQAYMRHTSVFAGIHDYARNHGNWQVIVDEWADHTLPAQPGERVPYDGLVGRISKQGADRAQRLGLPVVNVWFNSPAENVPAVMPDFYSSGRLQAEHLLSRGFRNFGIVYRQSYRGTVAQAEAFELTVRSANCEQFEPVLLYQNNNALDQSADSYEEWKQNVCTLETWLDKLQLPVGLMVYDVQAARLIIEMCANRDWRVPEDVAVVTGMNEGIICERPEPGITGVEFPYEQIGFEAARMLDDLMDARLLRQEPPAPVKRILLPPVGIIARRSTDFFAVDDPLVRSALQFIDKNLHRPLTIDAVANAIDISRRTLTSRFREKLQRSVSGEIARLRIERVKRALVSTRQSIQKIAQASGFASTRTLNDTFRSEVGCSPREYRQQHSLLHNHS